MSIKIHLFTIILHFLFFNFSFAEVSGVLLGSIKVTPSDGGDEKTLPIHEKFELLSFTESFDDPNSVSTIKYKDQIYTTSTTHLLNSSQDPQKWPHRFIIEAFRKMDLDQQNQCFTTNQIININEDKSCPLGRDGRLVKGRQWDFEAARGLILSCKVTAPMIVKREMKDSTPNCKNKAKKIKFADWESGADLSSTSVWSGCSPPPECTEEEIAKIKQYSAQREDSARRRCQGEKVKRIKIKDPICHVPFLQNPTKIVVHHTQGNKNDGPDILYNEYTDVGYADIPYHYIISKTSKGWRVFEGRPLKYQGASVGPGNNQDSVAIAITGDYRPNGDDPLYPDADNQPDPEAVGLLKGLVEKLKAENHEIKGIYGHGEAKLAGLGCHRECPSPACQNLINTLARSLFPGQGTFR